MRYPRAMRLTVIPCLLAAPLHAWEFTADPVCTLHHAGPEAEVTVTHDPRQAEPYAIAVTRGAGAWPQAAAYAIRFDGPDGFTITTNRHRLSGDAATVIASDTGFGNVLDGLEFNRTATALLGNASATVALTDAAPAVRKFRDCTGSKLGAADHLSASPAASG